MVAILLHLYLVFVSLSITILFLVILHLDSFHLVFYQLSQMKTWFKFPAFFMKVIVFSIITNYAQQLDLRFLET